MNQQIEKCKKILIKILLRRSRLVASLRDDSCRDISCLEEDKFSSCEGEVFISREVDECFGIAAVESSESEL
jgi:hypothetical protein